MQGYCPLLEMLLPYLAEIFDDVLVCAGSGHENTPGQGRGGAEAAQGAWARVQGLVTLGTADAEPFDLSPPTPLDAATTAGVGTTAAGATAGGNGGHGHASVWAKRAVVVTWAGACVCECMRPAPLLILVHRTPHRLPSDHLSRTSPSFLISFFSPLLRPCSLFLVPIVFISVPRG